MDELLEGCRGEFLGRVPQQLAPRRTQSHKAAVEVDDTQEITRQFEEAVQHTEARRLHRRRPDRAIALSLVAPRRLASGSQSETRAGSFRSISWHRHDAQLL